MRLNTKQIFSANLLSGVSVLGIAMLASTQARAVNVTGPINNISANARATLCTINFDLTVAGVTADSGGADRFLVEVKSGTNTLAGTFQAVNVGATGGNFSTGFFANPNTSGGPIELVVSEVTGTSTIAGELIRAPIPVSVLQNAGGICAQGIQNLLPTVDAGPNQSVIGGSLVSLQGSATDPEMDPLTFSWRQTTNSSVVLSDPTLLSPTFTAPARARDDQLLTLELAVTEANRNRTVRDTVNITVIGNLAPVASTTGAQRVAGASVVTLDASPSSDPEGDQFTYNWRQVTGISRQLSDPTAAAPTFSAPVPQATDQVLEFEVTVTDTFGESSTARQTITVEANQAPIANAGPDQTSIGAGATVNLDASASTDPESRPITYSWRQLSGTSVAITNSSTVNPSFVAPLIQTQSEALTFEVTVSDGIATASDTVSIVIVGNQPPLADAGPDQTVQADTTVTLDASGSSDADMDQLDFTWRQISGPTVVLSDNRAAQPSFTSPPLAAISQTLVFEVEVDDGNFEVTDTVAITIPANQLPVADIEGPAAPVQGGARVTLDGSASSDPEGQPLLFRWRQVAGPTVSFDGQGTDTIVYTAPAGTGAAQSIEFQLTVTDPIDASDATSFISEVLANLGPIADIQGPTVEVAAGSLITLDGSGSRDPEGLQLTYQWVQVSGPTVAISGQGTPQISFNAPSSTIAVQPMEFALTVTDPSSASDTANFTVRVAANQPPSASAGGSQSVRAGDLVTLDGSGSQDPDGDTLTYGWAQISGPSVTLSDATAVSPTFTAPAATASDQAIVFNLSVSDGSAIAVDTATITVLANRAPTANAGPDQGPIDAGQSVTLDGSGSSDPDGDTLTFRWVQTGGPAVTLSDESAAQPTFIAPDTNGTVTFQLTVSDGITTSTDDISIEVRAVGSITIVQRLTGTDTQVSFTSDVAALSTSLMTINGTAQVTAQSVPIGTYTVTEADLSSQGIAVTSITCSDNDSVGAVASRTATISLDAGEDVTCVFTAANSREAAQVAIYNYLTGRNALLLANQPDLQRRIDRFSEGGGRKQGALNVHGVSLPGARHLPVQASISPGQSRYSSDLGMALRDDKDRMFDLWTEVHIGNVSIGSQDARFRILHVGADLKLFDSVLVGATLQLDDFRDRDVLEAGEAEGNGFLIGPYVTAQLAPQLFVEARAAWGGSSNTVAPLANQFDDFDTSRSLYSGSIIGQLEVGKRTIFRPELTVRYLSEEQEAYTDSLGVAIPSQTVDQGDVSFRPRLSHLIEFEGGTRLRPFVEFEGIYTFGTEPDSGLAGLLSGTFADTFGQFRGRLNAGLDLMSAGGVRATVSGFYDGIGSESFSNEGVQISLSFGF